MENLLDVSVLPRYPLPTPTARPFVRRLHSTSPLTPSLLYPTYGVRFNPHAGHGHKLALISAFSAPYLQSGLDRFAAAYRLPGTAVQVESMGGSGDILPDWCLESDADVQWAHAASPGAELLLVLARDATLDALMCAVYRAAALGADVISASFGGAEFFGELAYNRRLAKLSAVFVASSGDEGGRVVYPSASDGCISIGGAVFLRRGGRVFAARAWEDGGGGPSRYTGIPNWQAEMEGIIEQSGSYRATPDVAMEACPTEGYSVCDSLSGRFRAICGTSVGAPIFAGLYARAANGRRATAALARDLYTLAGGDRYRAGFFDDIIFGNNGRYQAAHGFDLCTGLGRPAKAPLQLSRTNLRKQKI